MIVLISQEEKSNLFLSVGVEVHIIKDSDQAYLFLLECIDQKIEVIFFDQSYNKDISAIKKSIIDQPYPILYAISLSGIDQNENDLKKMIEDSIGINLYKE